MTLEEMLLENRVVFLVGEINHVAYRASSCSFFISKTSSAKKTIRLYINSPRRGR